MDKYLSIFHLKSMLTFLIISTPGYCHRLSKTALQILATTQQKYNLQKHTRQFGSIFVSLYFSVAISVGESVFFFHRGFQLSFRLPGSGNSFNNFIILAQASSKKAPTSSSWELFFGGITGSGSIYIFLWAPVP